MSQIKVVPLGAGQDVGRSCILVTLGGKSVMLDCGMHMGYNDERRFPDFRYISRTGRFDEAIDAVLITHFHLDHCGALPFFTEMCGYNGPIYMTYPTKAICPLLLDDYRKITVERKGETNFFTSAMIKTCMKKVIGMNVNESVYVDDELEIKAFYAGHVLGAAMFLIRVGSLHSVLYTGDYNMTPDRHLGAANVQARLAPSLLITETTYATYIRDSKRMREATFLKRVHTTVMRGGKVLIPVFALGRAQELCILVETYWERMGLQVPVYFSAGLTEKANTYYELLVSWTNQKIKETFMERNLFEFRHIKPFNRSYLDQPGPMVLFASPGMLHAGTSLEAFKKWCGEEKNMCIMPGYCVAGTVGSKVLKGQKQIRIDKHSTVTVRCAVESLSFSAHADSQGIMQLIHQVQPKYLNVMLVHGERQQMGELKENIINNLNIPCYDPANGEMVTINVNPPIPVDISLKLLHRQFFNVAPHTPHTHPTYPTYTHPHTLAQSQQEKEHQKQVKVYKSEEEHVQEEQVRGGEEKVEGGEVEGGEVEGGEVEGGEEKTHDTHAVVPSPQQQQQRGPLSSDAPLYRDVAVQGLLVMDSSVESIRVLDPPEALQELGLHPHPLYFVTTRALATPLTPATLLLRLLSRFPNGRHGLHVDAHRNVVRYRSLVLYFAERNSPTIPLPLASLLSPLPSKLLDHLKPHLPPTPPHSLLLKPDANANNTVKPDATTNANVKDDVKEVVSVDGVKDEMSVDGVKGEVGVASNESDVVMQESEGGDEETQALVRLKWKCEDDTAVRVLVHWLDSCTVLVPLIAPLSST